MQITPEILRSLSQGFNAAFTEGFGSVAPSWQQIAMQIASSASAENYGWMKDLPGMREWVGQRVILNLESVAAQIVNKRWEHTIAVKADDIADDNLGIYATLLKQQGEIAARHPDDLVWSLLEQGLTVKGFDNQVFFSANHDGFDRKGKAKKWANLASGTNTSAWYLVDLSRNFMKPLIFQLRLAPQFTQKTRSDDEHVFMTDEYVYGVKARYNAGFGFHQLAFASTDDLTAANYEAARIALQTQYRPDGSPLGVRPTHLIVAPGQEATARRLLEAELDTGGQTNIWRGTAQLIVSPYLGQ